ncbi:MAG: methylmalonyl-CoA epimerase [Rhodospirillales bacterium]|nr:methylmalonyl-CoA epimerase [Rhodospirillales bacterium]
MINAKAINHIGIATTSIEADRAFYENVLGAEFEGVEEVPTQKVKVGFFSLAGVRLELLEPTSDDSTIATFMEKNGGRGGLHHVAYTVDDIETRIAELKEQGIAMIHETPQPGAHHTKIAFLHPKASAGVLTEMCQPQQ